jgi:ribosomal protein S18 acetylase RimI-like enzyme
MAPSHEDQPIIGTATGEGIAEAFRLVFGGLPAEQCQAHTAHFVDEVGRGAVSGQGLLEARRGGRLVGAVWAEVLAGHAALVWPPRLAPGEAGSTAQKLLSAGCERVARAGAQVAQALVPAASPHEDAILRTAGFEPLAALLYMAWERNDVPSAGAESLLQYEAYDPAQRPRLERLVEATYDGTLDCAALNGLRKIEDVLTGYQATGVFSAQRWLYVRHDGRDVGCLLLADHPREGNVELVYMGLIPQARGNGWGREICRKAQSVTEQLDRARLVAAVDAKNLPALNVYASMGFRVCDRRTVYLKRFP